ncbi:MAG: hypothetical protein CME70_06215 [Halobacteriovorax sp.]|nr:hypothetical protein [Halobacteriovorax sp.]|tara:strand:+ start:453 stop:800 length:348 start_codon:yes stop_codon:yes gene_type:complete
MPLNYHKPGIGSTAEFQSSGVPFITSDTSSYTVDLEFVTSAVVVCSTGDDNSVAFGNLNDGVFTLPNGTPVRFEVKCKQIEVTVNDGGVSVCAEVTGIPAKALPAIDQNNLGSVA